jgi:hypothetical protein
MRTRLSQCGPALHCVRPTLRRYSRCAMAPRETRALYVARLVEPTRRTPWLSLRGRVGLAMYRPHVTPTWGVSGCRDPGPKAGRSRNDTPLPRATTGSGLHRRSWLALDCASSRRDPGDAHSSPHDVPVLADLCVSHASPIHGDSPPGESVGPLHSNCADRHRAHPPLMGLRYPIGCHEDGRTGHERWGWGNGTRRIRKPPTRGGLE